VVIAALLRLLDLAAVPLGEGEAVQALAAYRAAQGQGFSTSAPPLLLHVNTLLFALFEAQDGLARLAPALTGVGLVLAPLLLQHTLGRWGALGMALLLAISPTAIHGSRTLEGGMPAALGVMLLAGCLARFLDTWRSGLVTWGGLALAFALAAGAAAWGLLAGLAAALGALLWIWREKADWIWPMARPLLGQGLFYAVLALVVLASGLGFNPTGLYATVQQVPAFLARFSPPTGSPPPSPLLLLLAYEPLILLAALVGLVLVVQRQHGMGVLSACWAAASLTLLALMPGRQITDLLWVLIPLAALGGLAIEALVAAVHEQGSWLNEGLYLPISLTLWVHCGLSLARYAYAGKQTDLILAGLTLVLQLLLTAAFGFAISAPEPGEKTSETLRRGAAAALRAGGLSLGLILLAVNFSIGWRLAHDEPGNPRELLVRRPTAPEIRLLVRVAEQASTLNTGVEHALEITLTGTEDPVLSWYLRPFEVHSAQALQSEPPLVVAPAELTPASGYFYEAFPVQRDWSPAWSGRETARWWLYRESSAPSTVTREILLWVRADIGTAIDEER